MFPKLIRPLWSGNVLRYVLPGVLRCRPVVYIKVFRPDEGPAQCGPAALQTVQTSVLAAWKGMTNEGRWPLGVARAIYCREGTRHPHQGLESRHFQLIFILQRCPLVPHLGHKRFAYVSRPTGMNRRASDRRRRQCLRVLCYFTTKQTAWLLVLSELYRPSGRRLSAKLVPTLAGYRVSHPFSTGVLLCCRFSGSTAHQPIG